MLVIRTIISVSTHWLGSVILFLIPVFSQSQGVTGKWSGTMSYYIKFQGSLGEYERRIDITITNNVAHGTVRHSGVMRINGQEVCREQCSGSGLAELYEVSIYKESRTYRVHAISPSFTCRQTGSLCEFPEPHDMHPQDILPEDQPLRPGQNLNLLSGSETRVSQITPDDKATVTISWSLLQGPLDAVLIVSPDNYNNWMPKATADELKKGTVIDINMKLQSRNGGVSPFRVSRFELKLLNTSSEKGTTLNMPLTPAAQQLPDLRFLPHTIGESIEADQSVEVNSTDGKTGTATIGCYDGGAWTTLVVEAVLEGGFRVKGRLLTPTGVEEIPIPKRKAGSHIAESWMSANGNPVDSADHEATPGNGHKGDGLSAYEEYRGFIAFTAAGQQIGRPEFVRLDPRVKNLGFLIKKDDSARWVGGINMFKAASKVTPLFFTENEIGTDRKINKNKGHANVYEQYALKIENGSIPGSAVGMNEPIRRLRGVPKHSDRIVIDLLKIADNFEYDDSVAGASNMVLPYTKSEKTDNTVAHEIGHGVNLIHHGDQLGPYNTVAPLCSTTNPCYTTYVILDHHRRPITNRPLSLENAGAIGSEESGDLSCIMAYTSMYQWAYREVGREQHYFFVDYQPVGKKLCTSNRGTGINANNEYFGNAEDGNCLGQLKLKD